MYTDKLSGTSTREQRPGDTIVVVGIDRLGRNGDGRR